MTDHPAKLLRDTADWLMVMANNLDSWADQSLKGGWSTHQVDENRKTAARFREKAAKLYQAQSAFT